MRLAWPLLLLTSGCWELLPASHDPQRDAAHHEQLSCGAGLRYPEGLFAPGAITQAAPLYQQIYERDGTQARLWGAQLSLHPFPGVTSEDLARLLTCHAARRQLGRADEPAVANDPYWVPGHVVQIAVTFDDGATQVTVKGRDFETAQAIWARTRAFVGAP